MSRDLAPVSRDREVHPRFVRVAHWINAVATIAMILSGWRIYNAAPLFPFEFPLGLGGWLAGALAWHFAAMWLLVLNGLAYLLYGFLAGHFRRNFWPIEASAAWRDLRDAFAGGLTHPPGRYSSAQKIAFIGVIVLLILAVASGLAIWKPVQLQELTALMGGYDMARRWHFFVMLGLAIFTVLHVTLAVSTKGLLGPMITGRAKPGEAAR